VHGETALIKRYVNLGMAVAIDDSKGLMVPVIHHAEELNLVGLSRAVIDLAERGAARRRSRPTRCREARSRSRTRASSGR
jgi:2-oxoglutarate dehydrogenase E2 component (dihydrolipoamide succinyltransferase)